MDNLVSEEVLKLLQTKIDDALENKRLKKSDRLILEIHQLIVIYLAFDHQKVVTMWGFFRPAMVVFGLFVAAFVSAMVMGRVTVSFIR